MKLSFCRNRLNLPKIYFNRYMRYVPTLAVLLLFYVASFQFLMVNGPQIIYLEEQVEMCREYWWSSLLLVQNYVNICHIVSILLMLIWLWWRFFLVHVTNLVLERWFSTLFIESALYLPSLEVQTKRPLALRSNDYHNPSQYFLSPIQVSFVFI